MTEEIPGPQGFPVFGNAFEIEPDKPQESLDRIAKVYGPIFRPSIPDADIFVGNYALSPNLYDETKFQEAVTGGLEEVRKAFSLPIRMSTIGPLRTGL